MNYLERVAWFKRELEARTFPSIPAKLNWMWCLACQLFAFGGVPEDKVREALANADKENSSFIEDEKLINESANTKYLH